MSSIDVRCTKSYGIASIQCITSGLSKTNYHTNTLLCSANPNLAICLLHLLTSIHKTKPFLNERVLVQGKPRKRMLAHPRLEMIVDGGHSTGKNAHTPGLLQLLLEHIIAPVRLGSVSLQRIIVLLRVVVSVASQWTILRNPHHGSSRNGYTHLNQFVWPVIGPSVVNKKYSHFSKSIKSCAESPGGPIWLPVS